MFIVPIKIGRFRIRKALLDLGASINVIPTRAFEDLELGPLTSIDIKVQLADGTFITPRGIVENVLVQVEQLIFPVDFFILDMQDKDAKGPFMPGLPFMKTSMTKIDCFEGLITMEYNGDIVCHRVNDEGSILIPNASALEVHKDSILMTYGSKEAIARNADRPELTIDPSNVSDLGIRPTSLISKGKEKASSVLQVKDSPPTRPKEPVTGSTTPPKKGKQTWVVKAINSLRLKPFCGGIEKLELSTDGRKGPKSNG